MDMKKVFDSIYSISIPKNAKFITDNLIEATFDSPYNALNDTTTTVSIIDTKNLEQYPILIHNDSESLTGYSSSGDIKAVLRQIPHQKLMPSSVPKFKEKVTILEIIKGQRIIMRKILDENYCYFTKHKTISNEIVFSPDDKKICLFRVHYFFDII